MDPRDDPRDLWSILGDGAVALTVVAGLLLPAIWVSSGMTLGAALVLLIVVSCGVSALPLLVGGAFEAGRGLLGSVERRRLGPGAADRRAGTLSLSEGSEGALSDPAEDDPRA